MANAKLVKVHTHLHHNNHISPSRHTGDVISRKRSPSPFTRVCPSSFQRQPQSPAMTLDYSLPRGRDLETGTPPEHGLATDMDSLAMHSQLNSDHRPINYCKHTKRHGLDLHSQSEPLALCREVTDRDDLYLSPPPSSHSQAGEDHDTYADTPTKKNKRKLSSPRRRADVSDDEAPAKHKEPTKRKNKHSKSADRPTSPVGEDEDSGIDSYKSVDDAILDVVGGVDGSTLTESPSLERINVNLVRESHGNGSDKKITTSSNVLSVPTPLSSSAVPPLKRAHSSSSKVKTRKKSSASSRNRHPSENSPHHSTINSNSHTDMDSQPRDPLPSPLDPRVQHPNLPQKFLHPMLTPAGVTPAAAAALGFVPGLYFGHPGLHPSLPVLPPHLQQAYVAAAAEAAAQASAITSSSSNTSTNQTSSTTPSSSLLPVHHSYYGAPSQFPPSMLPSMLYAGVVPRSESAPSELQNKQQQPSAPQSVATLEKQSSKQSSTKHSAQSSKSQRHHRLSSSSTSSTSQLLHQTKPSAALPPSPTSSFQPNFLFNPSSHEGSANTSSNKQLAPLPLDSFSGPSTSGLGADPNDSSSSRPQSPEDLTMPGGSRGSRMSRKHRKNYKNMTRERRVEANARERTRVHTISAAFEALRRAVPSYSHNQKLSKLAILRIACSYIMSLARLGDMDYTSVSEHIGQPLDFAECVEMTTNTIQTEGRARRRH